jgi:hypothetical protein
MTFRSRCDGLGDHLLRDERVEQLTAQVLQQAQRLRGDGEAAPAAVDHCPPQRQARALAREPADNLHAPARLAEGALDEVRVADALPVLGFRTEGAPSATPGRR